MTLLDATRELYRISGGAHSVILVDATAYESGREEQRIRWMCCGDRAHTPMSTPLPSLEAVLAHARAYFEAVATPAGEVEIGGEA